MGDWSHIDEKTEQEHGRADDDEPQMKLRTTRAEADAEARLLSDSMVSARSDDWPRSPSVALSSSLRNPLRANIKAISFRSVFTLPLATSHIIQWGAAFRERGAALRGLIGAVKIHV